MILKLSTILGMLGSLSLLNGCAPAVFMGATTGVATSAAEERGLGGVISDTEIKARIFSLYSESDFPLNSSVDVVVRQGKVLLTGIVDTPKAQIEAVRLTWIAKGVKEVHDEIQVGQDRDVGSIAKDSWISTQLKTKMIFDEAISSINYNVHTIGGVVYLMGIAKSQPELDHLIDLARHISGVKQVISYVHVREMLPSSRVSPTEPKGPPSSSDSFAGPATDPVPGGDDPGSMPVTSSPLDLNQPNQESAFD